MDPALETSPETAAWRSSFHLSANYLLRWAEMASELFAGDHMRALVLNTFLRLNIRHLLDDPQLNLQYGGLTPPPDEERRPVSVAEAARAMAMPRATATRYVHRLIETNSLVDVGRGLIVPRSELLKPHSLALTDPNYQNVMVFMRRLQAAGLVAPPDAGEPVFGRGLRYRLVLRLAGEFVSDWMAVWNGAYSTGYLYGLVFAAVLQANHRDSQAVPDDRKSPIAAYAAAQSLKLPAETVRRHILRLEADGLLKRLGQGVIVPESALASPAGQAILRGAHEATLQMAREVRRYQVDTGA